MQPPSEPTSGKNRADGPSLGHLLAFGIALAVLVGICNAPQRINHDSALYLEHGRMVLEGAVPYCDFADVNPPLVNYLHVPPVWLAQRLGISPIVAFQGLAILVLCVSALEIGFLIQKWRWSLRSSEQGLVVFAWMALYLIVDWHGDVGQREHLFVLLYTPYLFLRILRHRGGSVATLLAVLMGIQAGVGASIKPHFLLAAALVELALLLSSRRWRTLAQPECMALAGVVVAYVCYWFFVPAAMREAVFGRWLPLIREKYQAYYVGYRAIIADILTSPLSAAALLGVLAAVGLLVTRRRLPLRRHTLALAALGVMGLVIALSQQKGWAYQRIPFETAGLLCLVFFALAGTQLRRMPRNRLAPPATPIWSAAAGRGVLLAAFSTVLVVWFVGRSGTARPEPREYRELRQIVQQRSEPGDRVLVLATSVRPAYPMLLQLDRRPSSRYACCCFPLAFAYSDVKPADGELPYRRYDEAPADERLFLDEIREDVERFRPRLIIVHNSAGWLGLPRGFNTFDYLCYSGWAKPALAPYREIPGPKGWKVFERKESVSKADIRSVGTAPLEATHAQR